MYIYIYIYIYGLKKKHIIYLKSQIFLFFSEALSKRREIFVILSKLCVFFNPYISSHT